MHEEKRRKKFVGQGLGVTPKSWLTPKSWMFFIVFDHANLRMHSLAEIHNGLITCILQNCSYENKVSFQNTHRTPGKETILWSTKL